jgi:hypothetical protein
VETEREQSRKKRTYRGESLQEIRANRRGDIRAGRKR